MLEQHLHGLSRIPAFWGFRGLRGLGSLGGLGSRRFRGFRGFRGSVCPVLSRECRNGFLGLLRDYHRDPFPHSLLRTKPRSDPGVLALRVGCLGFTA